MVLIACIFVKAAFAQSVSLCAPRDRVVARLAMDFDEVQAATALAARGTVFEFWVSDIGTWTIVSTHPDGSACLIASGAGFSGWGALSEPEGAQGDL
ncbi:MAG: hypothetical protein AAGI09_02835 [Pseudomonadota bacterium]